MVAGSETESHCVCSWVSVMLRAVVTGRSAWGPQRVGCRAVLTFASVPLCGGDQSSGPSVFLSASPLTLLIGAAGGPARPRLFIKVCVGLRPYQCCGHPLTPYQSGPPRGEIGRAAPFTLLFPANTECSQLSFCQCLCGVSLGVAWRTCFAFFPSP